MITLENAYECFEKIQKAPDLPGHCPGCGHIHSVGQVCVMIHTGSRGLGHQVASEALQTMDKAMYLMVLNQMILNFHALE